MRILITGAGGFLGSYLAQHLHYEIVALTRQQLDLADLNAVKEYFNKHIYDVVLHCGAAGRNTPWADDNAILSSNLASVVNLMTYRNNFGQLINIGTGAEFDISKPINNAHENDIFNCNPTQSYGLSKNFISRYLSTQTDCTTLRLFGCFDKSEEDRRLLKKFHSTLLSGNTFSVDDKPFDMISAVDFTTIVNAVINKTVTDNNVNCVYNQKYQLSEILKMYCETHNLDASLINVTGQGNSYTGNGDTLEQYKLPLLGLKESLSRY